jgi:hypothetical protein
VSNELDALASKLEKLASSLTDSGIEKVMTDVGVAAKKDMGHAIAKDLGGDNRFSGWKRVRLTVGFEHIKPGAIQLAPRINGPMQVAEQGRGPSKTGMTKGKLTWSDGVREIEAQTPQRALDGIMNLLGREFLNGR